LDPSLTSRLKRVWDLTKDHQIASDFDEMLACFCIDTAPEREIEVWEVLAQVFERHRKGRSERECQRLFEVLLDATLMDFDEMVANHEGRLPEDAYTLYEEVRRTWAAQYPGRPIKGGQA
jgi:hypothetical protein